MEKHFSSLEAGPQSSELPRARSRTWWRQAGLLSAVLVFVILKLLHSSSTDPSYGSFVTNSQSLIPPTDPAPPTDNVCLSASCVHAASELLYNLSPQYKQLDPCDDFEELVCGGWRERHDLRPDQGDAFTGTMMSENSQMLLRHILEAPYPDKSNHSPFSPRQLSVSVKSADEANFDKLKAGYEACLDEDTIKKVGNKPLEPMLQKLQQAYPLNDDSQYGLVDALSYMADLGITPFIMPYVGADDKDPDVVVVTIAPPYSLGLPAKEYYKDEKLVAKYESVVGNVTSAILQVKNVKSHEVVEFEKRLAAVSPDAEDFGDVTKTYNAMSLQAAAGLAPQLQLTQYIAGLAPPKVKVDRVIVTSPDYMTNLSSILNDTPRDVLQTYFLWKAIALYGRYIESDAVKPLKQFRNELQGKDPDADIERWRTCVSHVDDALGWILSRFFVEKAFSEKAKDFGDQIVSDIKGEFIEKLKVTEWMEKEVRELGIDKVHNIVQKIGYPTKSPDIMNARKLQKYYADLDISENSFFENAVSSNRMQIRDMWSALGKPVDRDEWGMTVPTVNAYYNPPGNEIVFPAGIMQFPVFDVEVPQYLSYGAFGSVSGHELSHAFDSTGRHYDQNGNYTDWWTEKTVTEFTKRADCFVDQYHNFTLAGNDGESIHVNGKLTLGENIADAGGVSAAFAAWKKRAAENPNQDLPGLDFFTQEQLFFVNYANWWCGATRKETAINRIYTDPHAPKWARILGTMANSRDFKEAFQCKKTEPVCELW